MPSMPHSLRASSEEISSPGTRPSRPLASSRPARVSPSVAALRSIADLPPYLSSLQAARAGIAASSARSGASVPSSVPVVCAISCQVASSHAWLVLTMPVVSAWSETASASAADSPAISWSVYAISLRVRATASGTSSRMIAMTRCR